MDNRIVVALFDHVEKIVWKGTRRTESHLLK